VPESPVFDSGWKNQWVLGDVMARGELETLALSNTGSVAYVDEMIAQYILLGDPLLRMDAAPARLEANRGGTPLGPGDEVVADAGGSTVRIDLDLVDETGLDRLEISDSEDRDYSGVVPELGGPDPRVATLGLDLPLHAQAYTAEIAVFDASYPELRRSVLSLGVPLPLDFTVDGQPVDPGSTLELEAGVARSMAVQFTSPIDLAEADVAVQFEGVDLLGVTRSNTGRDWSVTFDAVARLGEDIGPLDLVLAGARTELLQASGGPGTGVAPVVLRHVVFPNPMPGMGYVVVEVEGAVERARLSVYDLAGHEVSSRELTVSGTELALEFDARDRSGDELANGTYFYRVSVEGPAGSARSDMGRLVIMR
jgi:hypothetical protein